MNDLYCNKKTNIRELYCIKKQSIICRKMQDWKSQIVISNTEKIGLRKLPLVFTEQGVAMLSSVLNSLKRKISNKTIKSCINANF